MHQLNPITKGLWLSLLLAGGAASDLALDEAPSGHMFLCQHKTPDMVWRIPDSEALPVIFDLLEYEGLCLGGSSGINVAGAIRMAREMGPGHTIVTVLCDYGTRYQTKLFNPDFLRAKGLPVPDWMARKPAKLPEVYQD